jgi:hypothetical protein
METVCRVFPPMIPCKHTVELEISACSSCGKVENVYYSMKIESYCPHNYADRSIKTSDICSSCLYKDIEWMTQDAKKK